MSKKGKKKRADVVDVTPDNEKKADTTPEENAADIVARKLKDAEATIQAAKQKRAEAFRAELDKLQRKYNCEIGPRIICPNGEVLEKGVVVIPK